MGESRSKLKILLVGINNYIKPVSSLDGCEYDAMNILKTLKLIYEDQLIIEERILLNQDATRDNIICEFKSHFGDLGENDIALFFFSGHGSQSKAPDAFKHNTPNGMVESLVCYNSSPNLIYKLADKELSVLIWEVTKENNNPFALIFDCCHSGGIRKNENVKIRGVNSPNEPREWQDYYGAEHFHFHKGKVTVPMGRYILMAACRPDQYAQEKYIKGQFQGVFTHLLVETLKKCKKPFSYEDLKQQLTIEVTNEAYNQNPQLRSLLDEDLNCTFLSKDKSNENNSPIIFYNKNDQEGVPVGWVLNIGSIQGVKKNEDRDQNEICIYEEEDVESKGKRDRKEIERGVVAEVFPNFSTVFISGKLDQKKKYKVNFSDNYLAPLNITFDSSIDIDTLEVLKERLSSISFVNTKGNDGSPSYALFVENKQFLVKSESGDFIYFKGQASTSILGIKHLLECLKRISSWHNLKDLVNLDSSIDKNDLKLEFFHVLEPSFNFMEAVKELPIPNILDETPVLEHIVDTRNDHSIDAKNLEGSLFKLKITNLSNTRLWVSTLYLGSDFSITNSLMPITDLDPGEDLWLEHYECNEHKASKLIPLHIEDSYLKQGVNEITEHFKIIVSTREFETSMFNQKAAFHVNNRILGFKYPRLNFTPKDWLSIDFSIKLRALIPDDSQYSNNQM